MYKVCSVCIVLLLGILCYYFFQFFYIFIACWNIGFLLNNENSKGMGLSTSTVINGYTGHITATSVSLKLDPNPVITNHQAFFNWFVPLVRYFPIIGQSIHSINIIDISNKDNFLTDKIWRFRLNYD